MIRSMKKVLNKEYVIEIKDEIDPFSNLEAIESSKISSPETLLNPNLHHSSDVIFVNLSKKIEQM